jgi:DNA polymerase/3'-5' exonuclease PolX
MSTTKTRLPRAEAVSLAWEVVSLLSPYCERMEVCGSIRRNRETIGDIEIVAMPIVDQVEQHGMFGPVGKIEIDRLHGRCIELVREGELFHRLDKNGQMAFGSRHKRLSYRGFGLDLFAVKPPNQWGPIHLIRTGSAQFVKRLVTPEEQGGWCPKGLYFKDGQVWRIGYQGPAEPLDTPSEMDVFLAVGRGFIPPEEREV